MRTFYLLGLELFILIKDLSKIEDFLKSTCRTKLGKDLNPSNKQFDWFWSEKSMTSVKLKEPFQTAILFLQQQVPSDFMTFLSKHHYLAWHFHRSRCKLFTLIFLMGDCVTVNTLCHTVYWGNGTELIRTVSAWLSWAVFQAAYTQPVEG